MAKPLTEESKNTEPKFTVELDIETHINLIDYLIKTNQATKRNEFINSLIKEKLDGKVLYNKYIKITEKPFYFNKKELLENKTVKATNDSPPFPNITEIFVVQFIPNNLDDFNENLETYCVGNNPNMHAGYYILPKYKDHNETHFLFKYDSEKEELEISIEDPNNIDIVFNPLDDEKQKIKKDLLIWNTYYTNKLENNEMQPIEFITRYKVMYSYHLNLKLKEINHERQNKELTDEQREEINKIYFKGIYLE